MTKPDVRKTDLCFSFANGQCSRGVGCKFAHGERELQVNYYAPQAPGAFRSSEGVATPSSSSMGTSASSGRTPSSHYSAPGCSSAKRRSRRKASGILDVSPTRASVPAEVDDIIGSPEPVPQDQQGLQGDFWSLRPKYGFLNFGPALPTISVRSSSAPPTCSERINHILGIF